MSYILSIIVFAGITALGVLGTFVLTGLTGLFSLGQAAFMGLGAYVAALAVVSYHISFPLAIVLAVVFSLGVAFIIGFATLNIRQDFFVLVTFGFGEAVRAIMDESIKYTGGAAGFAGVPQLTTPWIVFGSLVAAVWLINNIRRSKFGRDCLALRTNELAAQVVGIDVFGHKLRVFLLGAGLSSYAGVLMAFYTTYVEPGMFGWMQSAIWIIMVFFGGRDSLTGTIVGVFVLSVLPEILRFASAWRIVAYCLIVLLIINFRPGGLLGHWELSFRTFGWKLRQDDVSKYPAHGDASGKE